MFPLYVGHVTINKLLQKMCSFCIDYGRDSAANVEDLWIRIEDWSERCVNVL